MSRGGGVSGRPLAGAGGVWASLTTPGYVRTGESTQPIARDGDQENASTYFADRNGRSPRPAACRVARHRDPAFGGSDARLGLTGRFLRGERSIEQDDQETRDHLIVSEDGDDGSR